MHFQTDKIGHGYLPTYLEIAKRLGPNVRVLEIGVASGDGLHMLQALFPGSLTVIAGVDISAQACWPEGTRRVICRQDHPDLADIVNTETGIRSWDLIVDDASHLNEYTRQTCLNMWETVRDGGFYVIEDWNHCNGLSATFARDLVDCLKETDPLLPDVVSMTYRRGLIVLEKGIE